MHLQTAEIERRIELETKAEKHIQKLLLLGTFCWTVLSLSQSYMLNDSLIHFKVETYQIWNLQCINDGWHLPDFEEMSLVYK